MENLFLDYDKTNDCEYTQSNPSNMNQNSKNDLDQKTIFKKQAKDKILPKFGHQKI